MNSDAVERYLDLKLSNIVKDTSKKKKILRNVIDILGNISIDGRSLIELIRYLRNDYFSFHIIDPFIYAVTYQEDKNLYHALVINRKNNDFILFSFELMAWMKKITNKIMSEAYEESLPFEIKHLLETEFGIDNKTGQPKYWVKFEENWTEVRRRYYEKIENSILEDLIAYLKIRDIDIAKEIAHKINEEICNKTDFPPPPYSIIINNYQAGFPIQLDKYIYFIECINTSKQLRWKEPELAELWIDLLRQAILKNEISFRGIKEIVHNFSTSQGDFRRRFVEELNKWAKNRTYEYQYPTFMLITAIAQLIREKKLVISTMNDFNFLPGTPAYNVKRILIADDNFIKKAVFYMKGYLYNANRYYFNYFLYENREKISELAKTFCSYSKRESKSDKETWEELIRLWLLQFEKEYIMDLALDILDNTLFVKTDDVISAFKKWIEENDLVDKINNEEVLTIYEPQSSIMNVLTELRNTLTKITISDSKWMRPSKLEMDNDKPKDSTLISLYLKKEEGKYYTDSNKKWTDIIYIEDNVGTGNQAINKIYALKKHLEDANLEDVNIYYWSYYVADIEDIKKKLRTRQLPKDAIVYHIDLRDYGNINNRIVWINDLLDKKYADNKDILLEKLKKLSLRISLSREPLEWVRKNNQWLGWGGLGLLVVFEYGTPNNTIPILWRDCGEYFSLFPRPKPQEKNTIWNSVKDIIERFGGKV